MTTITLALLLRHALLRPGAQFAGVIQILTGLVTIAALLFAHVRWDRWLVVLFGYFGRQKTGELTNE